MSKPGLFTRLGAWIEHYGDVAYHVNEIEVEKICIEYEQRIADLERTNILMAEQLKKRDGFWLAPMIPDEKMLAAVGTWEEPENVYAAMRDNWMERNK